MLLVISDRLYEDCTVDLDCSNPIEHAECDDTLQVCVCNELYIHNLTTNYSCPTRVLGDPCTYNAQCTTGNELSCSDGV